MQKLGKSATSVTESFTQLSKIEYKYHLLFARGSHSDTQAETKLTNIQY